MAPASRAPSVMLLQKMVRHNRGLFDDALFLRADCQPDELGHAPGERGGAAGALAENEMRLGGLGAVPNLLGDHSAGVGEVQHGVEVEGRVAAAGDFVFAPFAGKDWPNSSDSCALPRTAEVCFAIAVVIVAAKAGTVGGFDANGRVDDLDGACNGGIVRGTDPQAHEFKEAGVNDVAFVPQATAIADVELIAVVRIGVVVHADIIALGRYGAA